MLKALLAVEVVEDSLSLAVYVSEDILTIEVSEVMKSGSGAKELRGWDEGRWGGIPQDTPSSHLLGLPTYAESPREESSPPRNFHLHHQ